MKKEYNLSFRFKGSRDYVQGPDIFDSALSEIIRDFGEIQDIKYSAHNWIRCNAQMIIDNIYPDSTPQSLISFVKDGDQYFASINENSIPITDRKEYSEEDVNSKSQIQGNEIKFNNITPYTLSEVTVSMNKHFLQSTIKDKGKWIVTKLEYFNFTDYKDYRNETITIRLLKKIGNNLTKSEVIVNDKRIGFIYFSLV